jgi:hypothetical protein
MALKFASFSYVNQNNFDVTYDMVVIDEVTMNFGSGLLQVRLFAWKDAASRAIGVDPVVFYQTIPIDYFNDPVISPKVSDVSEDLWEIIRQHPLLIDYSGVRNGNPPVEKSLNDLGAVLTDIPDSFLEQDEK